MAPNLTCFFRAWLVWKLPLLYLCYNHTFVRKGLLYHFNRLHTTLAEIEAKLDANSLICSFCHFQTVNTSDERKKHVVHKHALRATQGVRPVTTAFREFVRDYWLRSYPAEAN